MSTSKPTPEQEIAAMKDLATQFKAQKASTTDSINLVSTKMTVHCATILISTDWNGLCDAWVEIVAKGGHTILETDVREKTLSPYWNKIQTTSVVVKDVYKVVVYDKDKIGKSKVGSGYFIIPIDNDKTFQSNVFMRDLKDLVVPIVNKDQKLAGHVTVSVAQENKTA